MGLRQTIALVLDSTSTTKLAQDFKLAGARGIDALKQEFAVKMADLRHDFSAGLIDERTYHAQSKRVADTFDKEVRASMQRLVATGKEGTAEYARLGAEIKAVGRESGPLSGIWTKMKGAVVGLGASLAAAFSVREVIQFGKEVFNLGMNAEETASKFQTTFGDMAREGAAFLEDFANKAGLSTQQGQDFLATIGAMVQGMGATAQASLPLSQRILTLAGDLQSFHNVPIQETFTALRSGLVGEYEPLRRFGIVLTAATVEMKAMEMTGKTNASQLTALEKSQAALTLAYEKAGPALGDLNRTSDSTSNTLRRMNAEWEDFKTKLGSALVEAVNGKDAIGGLGEVMGQLNEWFDRNRESIVAFLGILTQFVTVGFQKLMGVAVGTKNELAAVGRALNDYWGYLKAQWADLQIAFATAGQQIMALLLKLQVAALRGAEALGMKGMAERLRGEIARSTQTIGELGTFIYDTSKKAKRDMGADDPSATRTDTIGGAVAANVAAGAAKAETSLGGVSAASATEAAKAAKEWEKFAQRFQNSMDNSVNAAKKSFEEISEGVETYLDRQAAAQDRANAERLKGLATTSAAEDTIRENALRMELAQQERILQSATATQEEKRAAFERTTEIQAELDARAARHTLEMGDREAKSREAAEQRKREALLASGLTAEEVNERMEADAREAADETKTSWLEAAGVLMNALQNLGTQVGGVFGRILNGVSGIVSGLTAAASGFKAFSSVTDTGVSGLIQKVAGLAGGFGGVVSVAMQLLPVLKSAFGIVKDIAKGLGDALNIGGGVVNPESSKIYAAFQRKDLDWLFEYANNPAHEKSLRLLAQEAHRALLRGRDWGSWNEGGGGAPPPRSPSNPNPTRPQTPGTPSAPPPPPRPWDPTPTAPSNPWGIPTFQRGGWMTDTGLARLHAGELVLPPHVSRDLALVVAGRPVLANPASSHAEDNRQMTNIIHLYGVADRDVPDRVVAAISERMGQQYQRQAALQGNMRIGG